MNIIDNDLLSMQEARILVENAREAQKKLATFSQEKLDEISYRILEVVEEYVNELARLSFEETDLGKVEDKLVKDKFVITYLRNRLKDMKCVGVIGTDETLDSYHADILRSIGSRQKPETVAANLYRILREFDDLECDYMYSESFFEQGLGNAIMNRMLKAAGYHLITL